MGYAPSTIGVGTGDLTAQGAGTGQDVTSRAGSVDAASMFSGLGGITTVTAGSNNVTLTTLASGTALNVVSTAILESPTNLTTAAIYGNPATQTFTVAASGGNAVLSYTGLTATTITGIAIVSGTGSWTVVTGSRVSAQTLPLFDLFMGDSLIRGDGATFGVNDVATLLTQEENIQAGLIPPGPGLVMPFMSAGAFGTFQWNNTGSGTAVATGSPSVGIGGASPGTVTNLSSVKLPATGAVGDTAHPFRRVILVFQKQTNGDNIVFATTGVVVTSPTIDTNGSGLAFWDSGDLGSTNAGTGFTCTTNNTHGSGAGGATVVMVAAIYIQSGGINGSVPLNIAYPGTQTGDWNTLSAGWVAFLTLFANAGIPIRRAMVWLGINDQPNFAGNTTNTVGITQSNFVSIVGKIQAASPLTEVVLVAGYYASLASVNVGVGNTVWANQWVPAIEAAAIQTGATFINMYARFGDCSYNADPYGLTVEPGIHFGVGTNNFGSQRNSQQAHAELFFEKLNYSKVYIPQGTTRTGVAVDGQIVDNVALGLAAGRIQSKWFKNANDTQPTAAIGGSAEGGSFVPPGFSAGPGGSTALDCNFLRAGVALWKNTGGTGVLQTAIDTSATAAVTTPTPSTGVAFTPNANQDCELSFVVTTSTSYTVTMGPSTGSENTLISAVTLPIGSFFNKRIPKGWKVIITGTIADLGSIRAVTC